MHLKIIWENLGRTVYDLRVAEPLTDTSASEDPRWQRTRQALTTSVLELAAEHPIRQISVNQLTKHAGVDRTTFYNHAGSPEALLQAILTTEVEQVYLRFRQEFDEHSLSPYELQEKAFRQILTHVIARQEIYRSSLHNGAGNLVQTVIGTHFTSAAREMLDEDLYPFEPPIVLDEFRKEFASRSVSAGMVGGITAWLLGDDELDIDRFIDSFHLFLPAWFTMADSR